MQIFLKLLLSIFIAISLHSCVPVSVEKSMVRFDQAFIPVYFYVWKGDMVSAKEAVFNMISKWQHLNHKAKSLLPEDVDWQEGFRRTDVWLDDALTYIDANHQEYALAELDHARYELMEIRGFKGIPYYLDDLYNFQINVEEVYDVASDDMLCLLEWGEFEIMVKNIDKEWQNIQAKPIDETLFELNKYQIKKMEMLHKMIAHQMEDVMQTLDCGNHLDVAVRVKTVEVTFMKMLCTFGVFPEKEAVALDI